MVRSDSSFSKYRIIKFLQCGILILPFGDSQIDLGKTAPPHERLRVFLGEILRDPLEVLVRNFVDLKQLSFLISLRHAVFILRCFAIAQKCHLFTTKVQYNVDSASPCQSKPHSPSPSGTCPLCRVAFVGRIVIASNGSSALFH